MNILSPFSCDHSTPIIITQQVKQKRAVFWGITQQSYLMIRCDLMTQIINDVSEDQFTSIFQLLFRKLIRDRRQQQYWVYRFTVEDDRLILLTTMSRVPTEATILISLEMLPKQLWNSDWSCSHLNTASYFSVNCSQEDIDFLCSSMNACLSFTSHGGEQGSLLQYFIDCQVLSLS